MSNKFDSQMSISPTSTTSVSNSLTSNKSGGLLSSVFGSKFYKKYNTYIWICIVLIVLYMFYNSSYCGCSKSTEKFGGFFKKISDSISNSVSNARHDAQNKLLTAIVSNGLNSRDRSIQCLIRRVDKQIKYNNSNEAAIDKVIRRVRDLNISANDVLRILVRRKYIINLYNRLNKHMNNLTHIVNSFSSTKTNDKIILNQQKRLKTIHDRIKSNNITTDDLYKAVFKYKIMHPFSYNINYGTKFTKEQMIKLMNTLHTIKSKNIKLPQVPVFRKD